MHPKCAAAGDDFGLEILQIWDEMINGDLFPYGSYFYNLTGSKDYDNFLVKCFSPPQRQPCPLGLQAQETDHAGR